MGFFCGRGEEERLVVVDGGALGGRRGRMGEGEEGIVEDDGSLAFSLIRGTRRQLWSRQSGNFQGLLIRVMYARAFK